MRKYLIAIILFSLFTTHLTGQNKVSLNGYKYVYVMTLKYNDGGIDSWGISKLFRTFFEDKGFIVLTENSTKPNELANDLCLGFSCYLDHTNNSIGGVNEVTMTLKNCNNEVIIKNTGTAMGWTQQDDYNMASKKAFSVIKNVSYNFEPSNTPELKVPTVENTSETEESIRTYLTSNKLDPIEGIYNSYQSPTTPHYKIGIIKKENVFKAIIIESDLKVWKSGEVKGVFDKSSMKGFYSAKWFMGYKSKDETFATLENNVVLSIEVNDNKGEKIESKFIKMFPTVTGEKSTNKNESKASGSGFFLTTDGIIATNAHVIEDAANIEITFTNEIGSFTHKAKVLLTDAKNDVALLKIDDEKFKGFNSIPFGINDRAETGEKVFTIGYPLNDVMGTNYKVNDGIISSKTGIADDVRYYQISVPLQPGNSGGPLFNKDGNVIGITSARLNGEAVGTKVENVNYAIKGSYLLNLYNMLPNSGRLNSTSQVANKELQEQVKVLKNYVCLIRIF